MYYCAHCNYKSQAKSNVKRHQSFKHQSFKHNSTYDEVVEHPLLKQMDEKPMDLDLMEDSIEVFKIYKLLQRMKNKWCLKSRGKGKKKQYLVHYRGWPSTYDEWKNTNEMKQM